jgi:Domain of unknown function (DUF5671)
MENHTAKHFVLQLGSLVSLYLSLSFLIVLLFGVINRLFPDAADQYYQIESYQSDIRLGIAMVVVFFPTYVLLTRTVNRMRRDDTGASYLSLTKWLVYLSLLVAGLTLLGDLVTVIMTYLNGEITQRFIFKAVAVLLIVGAAFYYYLLDARGYWLTSEKKSVQFAAGAIIVVLAALGFGIANVQTPGVVREQRLDATEITDLQTIQWSIQDYSLSHGALPQTLSDLTLPKLPTAPENRPAYQYKIVDGGFELCATFAQPSTEQQMGYSAPIGGDGTIKNPDNWQHDVGETCFKRILTPTTAPQPTAVPIEKK